MLTYLWVLGTIKIIFHFLAILLISFSNSSSNKLKRLYSIIFISELLFSSKDEYVKKES